MSRPRLGVAAEYAVQNSVAGLGKSKAAGITPTTRWVRPSRTAGVSRTAGSDAKYRRHADSLSTTTSAAGRSSSGINPRPRRGRTANMGNNAGDTAEIVVRSAPFLVVSVAWREA